MVVMAVDPGETTGVFIAKVKGDKITPVNYWEIDAGVGTTHLMFDTAIKSYKIELILMESVVLHGLLSTAKAIQIAAATIVETLAYCNEVPLTFITPEERKRAKFISESGVKGNFGHARDAAKLVHAWIQRK